MKKVLAIFALMALAFAPAIGWSAGMSDDVTRDTTPGDPFELQISGGTLPAPTVIDPVATQEVFYAVRGADGVIYYTMRDVCPDNAAACHAVPNPLVPATFTNGQDMRKVGFYEFLAGHAPFSPVVGVVPPAGIAFGPPVGTAAEADFGGEFFAATNIIGIVDGIAMGPGINGDPVLSGPATGGMGDANADGWPGGAGQTPWASIPTGQSADSDPDLHYMTATYPNQWGGTAFALLSDPLRSTTPISPFDIMIEVRGNNGTIYRTAYNLNAVLVPPAVPTPPIPVLNSGTGAAMAYVDRVFPSDVTGACNIGDGFPGCATRFNPITGFLVNDSGQEQTPWRAIAN